VNVAETPAASSKREQCATLGVRKNDLVKQKRATLGVRENDLVKQSVPPWAFAKYTWRRERDRRTRGGGGRAGGKQRPEEGI